MYIRTKYDFNKKKSPDNLLILVMLWFERLNRVLDTSLAHRELYKCHHSRLFVLNRNNHELRRLQVLRMDFILGHINLSIKVIW